MNKRNYLILGSFLGMCLNSYGLNLTIDQVIERTRSNNSDIKIQEYTTDIAKKNKDMSFKNLILPPVVISAEEEWDIVKEEGFGANEIEIRMPIFVGGRNINSYKKSKNNYYQAEKLEEIIRYTKEEEAVAAFFSILNDKKEIEVLDRTIEVLEKQKERLEILFNSDKLVAKSELLKVEANIEKNKATKLSKERNLKIAEGELSKILGLSIETNYEELIFDIDNYKLNTKELEAFINQDVLGTNRGELESLKVEEAEYNLKIAKGSLYPSFYVGANFQYKREENEKFVSIPKDDRWTIEVGFSYTFNWGGTVDNIKKEEWSLEQAKLQYNTNIKELNLDIQNNYNEIYSYYNQSKASKKEVNLLRENMNIDQMRYENELITTYDYLNSVNSYRTAQSEYYEIIRDLVLSQISFENYFK